MNKALFDANPTQEDPLILTSAPGHVQLTGEILQQSPEIVQELDKDGFSPLHVAAATGQVETVRAIMGIDRNLCRLKGRNGKTPLHVAALKGKVDVIREIILRCVECLDDVTDQGETALHLAVKHNRFEAVMVMVELIRDMKRDDMLNKKDKQGNTLLHLATWRKHLQAIELLLEAKPPDSRPLEVNAVNDTGVTAMDLLLMFPSEAGDREIYEILSNAGAQRGRDVVTLTTTEGPTCVNPDKDDPISYFTFKRSRDSPSDARTALLVVASLVATAMFQVGLSPPGGTWQDNYTPVNQSNGTITYQKAHKAGESIMGTSNGITFILFVLFSSIGFSVSLWMINILTHGFPLQFELQVCMLAMYISYNTAMNTIAPDNVQPYCILITSIISAATPALTRLIKGPVYKLLSYLNQILRRIF